MSDFDKEKERERLREKYEQDQQKRETAEKMSELLLQGATMTNAHCSECGDPIFRYDGQEFCATCEKPVDRGGEEAAGDADGEADAAADGSAEDSETIEVAAPSDEARVQFGGEPDGAAPGDGATDAASPHHEEPADRTAEGRESAGAPGTEPTGAPGTESTGAPDRNPPRQSERREGVAGQAQSSRPPAPAGDDVSAARASLVRTLSRFSERAEQCEDPQRATEHLAAAREAAEALSALRR